MRLGTRVAPVPSASCTWPSSKKRFKSCTLFRRRPERRPCGHQVGSRALQVNRRAVMKKKRARQVKRANNVFLELGFPPHEAAVMLLRCELAEALRKWMDREAISQVEAAKRLGVVQP